MTRPPSAPKTKKAEQATPSFNPTQIPKFAIVVANTIPATSMQTTATMMQSTMEKNAVRADSDSSIQESLSSRLKASSSRLTAMRNLSDSSPSDDAVPESGGSVAFSMCSRASSAVLSMSASEAPPNVFK
mmetsp:Transcript_64187/g.89214  ORF Transcript_64187/g.89214 Transcript_64187/m.89214 type:complete len:130 (+) Transcript_64187:193-582(+)